MLSREKRMKDNVDVRLACCVLNKKLLLKHIEEMTLHDTLRVVSENNESMKEQMRKFTEKYSCHIVGTEDSDDISYITIKKKASNRSDRIIK